MKRCSASNRVAFTRMGERLSDQIDGLAFAGPFSFPLLGIPAPCQAALGQRGCRSSIT